MSSSDALHPQQLQMFMPARELVKIAGRAFDYQMEPALSQSKEPTEEGRTLHEQIAEEGVKEPVTVRLWADDPLSTVIDTEPGALRIIDGLHRTVSSFDARGPSSEVPVLHE